jgi:hypothetical protein
MEHRYTITDAGYRSKASLAVRPAVVAFWGSSDSHPSVMVADMGRRTFAFDEPTRLRTAA